MSTCTAAPAASLARQTAAPRPKSRSLATPPQLTSQRPSAGGSSTAAALRAPNPLAARGPCRHAAARVMAATAAAQVVLTREQGKNDALRKVLEGRGISCLELPMVETAAGPDQARLPQVPRAAPHGAMWYIAYFCCCCCFRPGVPDGNSLMVILMLCLLPPRIACCAGAG